MEHSMTEEQQFHIEAQIQMNLQNEGERIQTKDTGLATWKLLKNLVIENRKLKPRASVAKRLTLLALVQLTGVRDH